MRNAARNTVARPAHLQPGRYADQGRRQVGDGRIRHSRQQGPAAVPLVVRRLRAQGRRNTASFNSTSAQIVVLALAYDSRTKGNVATEIVKYFYQLHFGIKKDYRLPDLLKRGNFYQSN